MELNIGDVSLHTIYLNQKPLLNFKFKFNIFLVKPPAECLFKCSQNYYIDVYPGDIIVFDSNKWFHSTEIIGNDLSLTIGSEYD